MNTGTRITILSALFIIATCLASPAAATSLGIDWKQSPMLADSLFSGIVMTPDGSTVFTGGSQLMVRNWDGPRWGGKAGFVAAMSPDGSYVATCTDNTVTVLNRSGFEMWSRNMDGKVKAVAIAKGGEFVITADDKGNYNAWTTNGEFIARNQSAVVKRLAVSPTGNLVVATTESGIRFYSASLDPVWTDPRAGSLDDYIVISDDGATVITAGGPRLSSHTAKGVRNWQVDVTDTAINDVACTQDCSLVLVGSQDNTLKGIDRYGKTRWTYGTSQWVNAVGTSANGAVIAAGVNDGTVIVLDHRGRLQTEKKFDPRIQPRTLAVSRDGTRIAVADQHYLYGLSVYDADLTGESGDTIYVTASATPAPKTSLPTTVPTTMIPEVTMPEETRPTTTTTKASPVGAYVILPGIAGALWLAGKGYRKT